MEDKYSAEESKSIRTGMVAMLIILVAVFITVSHNASVKRKKLSSGYSIYANFGRTDGLEIGNVVRMSGVNIGRVVASELDPHFNSKLTMEIDSKYKIPDDSSASIVSFGLIGGKYVEIEVGGSEEYLKAGDSISYTQDAMVLEELLDRIISLGKAKRTQPAKDNKKEEVIKEEVEAVQDKNEQENIEQIPDKAEEEKLDNLVEEVANEDIKGDENE